MMEEGLTFARTSIARDRRGALNLTVTNRGAEVALGHRLRKNLTVAGYAGRSWQGRAQVGGRLTWEW